mgnify:CR=1 FL=1
MDEDGNFYKLIDDKNRKRVTAISYHQVELFDELRQADDRWVEGDDNSDHGPIVDELIGWTIGGVRYLVEKFEKKMEWERRQGNIPKGEYEIFAEKWIEQRIIASGNKFISVTEHSFSETEKLAVVVNNSPEEITSSLKVADNWEISKSLYGNLPTANKINIVPQILQRLDAVKKLLRKHGAKTAEELKAEEK